MWRSAALLPLVTLLVGAGQAELEGKGESPVIAGNLASARNRALLSARQDCLIRAVAGQLGVERSAREAVRLAPVLAQVEQLLRSYRILEEGEQSARFVVRLACVLEPIRLRRAIEVALAGLPPSSGDSPWQVEVEAPYGRELSSTLLPRARGILERGGIRVTDRGTGDRTIHLEVKLLELPAIRGLGWPAIRGMARLTADPGGMSAQAEVINAAPTLKQAELMAAEGAIDRLLQDALPLLQGGARLELRVTGLRSSTELQEVMGALDEVGAGARLRGVDSDGAQIMLKVLGGAPALATSLRHRSWGKLTLSAQQLSRGALWLIFTTR